MSTIPLFSDALAAAKAALHRVDLERLTEFGIYRRPLEYYLVGTYPPIKAMDPVTPEEVFVEAAHDFNVYVHVPFCETRCTFCHFTKEINPRAERVTRYLDALQADVDVVCATLGAPPRAHTIYLGGGTPSYLLPTQLEGLFTHLARRLDVTPDAEITFELHPGVVRCADCDDRLRVMTSFGVNRVAFGVQSMDDRVLRNLNRGHARAEVFMLLDILHRHGVDNVSLDLMFGLPYQTLENWYATLIDLLDAGVTKFNVFPLMFKMSDPITQRYRRQPEIFPDGQTRLLMHFMGEHVFAARGFKRGPVFYYALADTHSRQQESKFENIEHENLLPFGVSGFGYVGHTQYFNQCDIDQYMASVMAGRPPVWLGHTLSVAERMRRFVMFAIRAHGVSRAWFVEQYGTEPAEAFPAEFHLLQELGLLHEVDRVWRLTDIGVAHVDGIGMLFASDAVKERIRRTNSTILDYRRDLREIHDFSPVERLREFPVL